MTYLIIGFVLLLVVAPIFAILPSAKDKQKMAARRAAMSQGVSVELVRIDDPIPRQDKYLSNTGKQLPPILSVAAYRLARPKPDDWRLHQSIDWAVQRQDISGSELPGNWVWQPFKPEQLSDELSQFLVDNLEHLPSDVVRVDHRNHVLSVYWQELSIQSATQDSSSSGIDSLLKFLKNCALIPTHRPFIDAEPKSF